MSEEQTYETLESLLRDFANGIPPNRSPEFFALCDEAARQAEEDAESGVDIDEWARRLGEELGEESAQFDD